MTETHLFDAAIALKAQGDSGAQGATGAAHPAWNNMVGPFGGISAATVLNAVMQHPDRLGEPVALTVNFAGALAPGPFTVLARAARTNRSTQHWTIELRQSAGTGTGTGDDAEQVVVLTATAMTALRRDTWAAMDTPMPQVQAPQQVERMRHKQGVEWLNRYDMRAVQGAIPSRWDGQAASDDPLAASLTQLWMRDDPPRALDYCALAAIADIFFPRIWLRRATLVPVGTVSMTVYFHADQAELTKTGTGYVLGQARAQAFGKGFFDQTAQLWSESGLMLATTHQVVYYKH